MHSLKSIFRGGLKFETTPTTGSTQSQVVFTSGPTLVEITDTWAVEFGAEEITITELPILATLSVTFGIEQITVTG